MKPARVAQFECGDACELLPHAVPLLQEDYRDHLLETHALVRRWKQPAWLQNAAMIHSVYGTGAYQPQLLPLAARSEVAAVAGERAERLAYLFCVTPRGPLLAGTHRWARAKPGVSATTCS